MQKMFLLLLFQILFVSCVKKEPDVRVEKVLGCAVECPVGYECDANENRCISLPHAFSCMESCESDKYCSAFNGCKPNPIFCQMGQTPTKCGSNADCYAGQGCVNSFCLYPLCKCTTNADCDAINQICHNGLCDCFELGCKSDGDCPEDYVCVMNYPLCGQCVQGRR